MVGALEDTHNALASGLSGEFTQGDLHKLRRLLPAQNVPGLAALLTEGEERTGLPH